MNKLIEDAKNVPVKKQNAISFSIDGWELCKAYLRNELTQKQVATALKINIGHEFYRWVIVHVKGAVDAGFLVL